MLVLTRTTLAATFPVPFILMATPSAGCAQGPRCQSPTPSLTWSGRLESTSTQRSSSTTRAGPRRQGSSSGRSSTTADTCLLDGGLTWTAEGQALSSDAPPHEPRAFTARLAEGVYCSLDQAKAAVDDDGVVVWDVRGVGEFEGTTKGWNPPPRLGHLPGAIHLEWAELFDSDNGTLKPADEHNTLLGAKGITPQATVVAY